MRFPFILPLLLTSLASAVPTRFEIKDAGLRNLIYWVNDAPLEKMIGLSNAIDGWVELNPYKIREGIKGAFSTDLRTLETGSEGRNEFLREKVFQAADNPIVTFDITKLLNATGDVAKRDVPVVAKLEGQLKLRGVQKPVTLFLRLNYLPENEDTKTRLPGNLLKISTTFDVDLSEFGLAIPEAQAPRIARQIQVAFDAMATDVVTSKLVLPIPEGPKPKDPQTRTLNRVRMPSSEDSQ
ncbi:MAG: YceI family protein [Deltaproteobacteria bacterium]|nr:YceI family protein [Deltaproteobacteria bacterium]MBI3294632.1 YceI family protein [Deltaproteobacteria bacterium]